MECRVGCGACCIAISISSSIPRMPNGKDAGIPCINLSSNNICKIHNTDEYPDVCKKLKASIEMCGNDYESAFEYLTRLEELTKP